MIGEPQNGTPTSIEELIPDPENGRKRTPRGHGMIVDSLQQLGAARSIVIDEQNVILAGNGVVEAAAEAGITKLKVVDVDGDEIVAVRRKNLSAEQKIDLALRDNRAAELAEWDIPVLKALDEKIDLSHLFTDAERSSLFGDDEKIAPVEPIEIKRAHEVVWMLLAIPVDQWAKYQPEVEKLQLVSRISPLMVARPEKKNLTQEPKAEPQ